MRLGPQALGRAMPTPAWEYKSRPLPPAEPPEAVNVEVIKMRREIEAVRKERDVFIAHVNEVVSTPGRAHPAPHGHCTTLTYTGARAAGRRAVQVPSRVGRRDPAPHGTRCITAARLDDAP